MSSLREVSRRRRIRYVLFSIFAALLCVALLGFMLTRNTTVMQEVLPRSAKTYYVAPNGDNAETGKEKNRPLAAIQTALNRAHPGDTVHLADGSYYQSFSSVRSGTKRSPITIVGSKSAVVYGDSSRIVQINHDYLELDGFQVNGQWSTGESEDHFRDKLIYVIGTKSKEGVKGLKLTNLLVQNAGGECIRLRYFAKNNEISHSTIRNCGIHDFRFAAGGKNGEGIYIGTAPEQRKDGKNPTSDPDESSHNYIHHNIIETHGNECVDIKEAAFENLVERNICRNQLDPESGGFDARGDRNVFRNNTVENTVGSAVRLGGDADTDGIKNDVYNNVFKNNAGGSLNIQREPQGRICGNSAEYRDDPGSDSDDLDPTQSCS